GPFARRVSARAPDSLRRSLNLRCLRPNSFSGAGCRRRAYWFVLRDGGGDRMLYAILCYDSEDVVGAWSKEEDDAGMVKRGAAQERGPKQGRLGPVARLLPTTSATTLPRNREEPLIIDGPFAETKEQLLGFFVVDCATLDAAIEAARELAAAHPSP